MGKYPFKFLDSYNREDRSIFFGRDEEIAELYDMVFQSSVILIYGGSGTGKTSLINCGLAGKFQPHDWLPLMIRRGTNINDSLERELNNAGGNGTAWIDETSWHDDWSDEPEPATADLSPVSRAIRAVYEKSFKPIYLVFDQFEELFIIGSLAEQQLFTKQVQDILRSDLPVKLIFSIREEYLGHLFDFERAVPQLLRKKLRIEPMNLEKVKQVIIGAASFEDSIISIKPGETDQVAEGIFNKIKGKGKSLTIQLPFLQVFLDKFYLKITHDESRQAHAEFNVNTLQEMGDIGDILIDFLEEQVTVISQKLNFKYQALDTEATWKILSPLSTLEGTKEPISKKGLYDRLPGIDNNMIDDVVDAFITSRILRYNEATDTFEITHDSLAMPISKKRSAEETALLEIKRMIKSQVSVKDEARELFTEKQLLFIEPFLEKFKASEEEMGWIDKSRKFIQAQKEVGKRKRKKQLMIAGILVSLLISLLAVYAFRVTQEARRLNNIEFARKLLVLSNNARLYGDFEEAALISRAAYLLYIENGGKDFNDIKNFYLDMFEKLQVVEKSNKEETTGFDKVVDFDSSFLFSIADSSPANSIELINGYVYSGYLDGKIIKTKWTDKFIQPDTFFDFKKLIVHPEDELETMVTNISVSNDQHYMAVGGGFPFVQLFDLDKKAAESFSLKLPDENDLVQKTAFTDKGNLLVFTGNGNLLMMAASEFTKLKNSSDQAFVKWHKLKQVNFQNGKYISVDAAVQKGSPALWNAASLSIPGVKFNCMSVFKDQVAIGIDSGLLIIRNDSLIKIKYPNMGVANAIQFDTRGDYLYIGSETQENKKIAVKICKVKLSDFSIEFNQSQAGSIKNITCSSDGNFIATASEDGSVGIYGTSNDVEWKYATALLLSFPDSDKQANNNPVPYSLEFSNDNKYLLAGYENGALYKWPVNTSVLTDLICERVKVNWDSVYTKYADAKDPAFKMVKKYLCK